MILVLLFMTVVLLLLELAVAFSLAMVRAIETERSISVDHEPVWSSDGRAHDQAALRSADEAEQYAIFTGEYSYP